MNADKHLREEEMVRLSIGFICVHLRLSVVILTCCSCMNL
jgi:hypothetical protein